MPLLSSSLLLRTHALTLLTTSYLLLTSPDTLLSASPIWVLGESMHIRPAAFQPKPNPLTGKLQSQYVSQREDLSQTLALLAVTVSVYAVLEFLFAGDLSTTSLTPSASRKGGTDAENRALGEAVYALHSAQTKWMTLAGLRVVGMGALAGWMYVFHSERFSRGLGGSSLKSSGLGSLLANQVVFTVAMMDMLFWGYLWTVLREEGREVAKVVERRREERDE